MKFLNILISLLFPSSLLAFTVNFSHLGIDKGLSHSTVADILQDRYGFMWFATYNGLNRYDGYDFKVYYHDAADSLSIGSSIIRCMEMDENNGIWIGTDVGLSLYDPKLDVFYNYFYGNDKQKREVGDIVCLDDDKLLLSTKIGLQIFDTKLHKFDKADVPEELKNVVSWTIYRYDDTVYISSDKGLFEYSLVTKKVRPLLKGDYGVNVILSILKLSDTELWIGTEGSGLYRINPMTGDYENFRDGKCGLSSNYVRSLAVDVSGCLWVGTINSLNIFQKEKNTFTVYESNPLEDNTLSHTSVRSLYKDNNGGMWVGTYFGGVNYYHPLQQRFHNIRNVPYHNSLSHNVISCIVEDECGNLWIGTNDGGLNKYDAMSHRFTCYSKEDGLAANDIKTVYVDESTKKVYIGMHTSNGLSLLDQRSGIIKNYMFGRELMTERGIYQIIYAGGRELLLGATHGTVLSFDMDTEKATLLSFDDGSLLEQRVSVLFKDTFGRIWMGTHDGIKVYNRRGDTLYDCHIETVERELRGYSVNVVHESVDGVFWIGTSNGLYKFTDKDDKLFHYTVSKGLPNNVVVGILEDKEGKLWISTEHGMSCFSPDKCTFRNYTATDGIQSNQFTPYAYCRTNSGRMYFGGVNGITEFNPSSLPDNPYMPSVVITDLSVSNKIVEPNDDTGILVRHISETKEITLLPSQSVFSLYFSVPDYISGCHNMFAYRLDGYEDEWVYTDGSNRTVSYSNLLPGKYRFMIKAANKDGLWNNVPTELDIIVLPAWYDTWWARGVFVAFVLIAIILVARFLWFRKSVRMQLEMERIDKERMKEMHESKLRFFINLSHELRTPLTLILAPLREAMNSISDKKVLSKLKHVNSNANRLLYLVNQLMDYRRAELGIFKLKVKKQELFVTVSHIYQYYKALADDAGIDYELVAEQDGKEVWYDSSYIELILNNLLSNAFKYTERGGSVTLSARYEDGRLLLKVADTGKGIPMEKQKLIFERFYQIDKDHIGSGIGLSLVKKLVEVHHGTVAIESEQGKGSVFIVELPGKVEDYTSEEICYDTEDVSGVYSTNPEEMYLFDVENTLEDEAEWIPESENNDKNATVLVVEDNVEIREYLSSSLSRRFNVLKAGNGEEALSIIDSNTVNLVITDVMMPVMDGIQMCKRIKRNIQTCHIPVIMLSAKSDVKDRMEGLNTGADDYIPKPFYIDLVVKKVNNMLRTYMLALEHYAKSDEVEPEKVAMNAMDKEFLEKAMEVVKEHLNDIDFTANVFASEMNMARSTLHNKIKAVTGNSALDFIRKIRFSEACRLLKEGKYSVTEIGEMVGFNTPSYFSTSFKKYIGCLPSEYAKRD